MSLLCPFLKPEAAPKSFAAALPIPPDVIQIGVLVLLSVMEGRLLASIPLGSRASAKVLKGEPWVSLPPPESVLVPFQQDGLRRPCG